MNWRDEYKLRSLQYEDLELVLAWRNKDRIRSNMYSDHLIGSKEHYQWFSKLAEGSQTQYLIFEIKQCPKGLVYFTDIDIINKKSQWGFYLGEEGLSKGSGFIMGFLGMEYAFERLGLRKLCGESFAFNLASLNFFKKLGFVQEGYFVKHVLKRGKYEDVLTFAIFDSEWQQNRICMEKIIVKIVEG